MSDPYEPRFHWEKSDSNMIEMTELLNQRQREIDMKNATKSHDRITQCVNACAGIENPEVAIREAISSLKDLLILIPDVPPWALENAQNALAKLQPKQG